MKKSKLLVVALVTLLLVGVFALPTLAQSPVTAEVDRTRLSTDEALLLKISVDSSAGQATQPVLPALDGFELLGSLFQPIAENGEAPVAVPAGLPDRLNGPSRAPAG